MERFRRLALITATATLILVAQGALVRATDSGLGCLDEWPRCLGGWVAPLEYHALIEWSHRAIAGIVGLLVVATAVAAWVLVPRSMRVLRWAASFGIAVVVAQALLGRMVVETHLRAVYVTAHFLLAMALVAVTSGVAARAFVAGRQPASSAERRLFGMVAGGLGAMLALLVSGAYVRQKGAGLAFGDWPLMGGRILPSLDSLPATAHFIHRVLVVLVFAHLIALFLRARRDARPDVRFLASAALGLFTAQIFVGAANVWTLLAPAAVLGHVALSALIWASLVALAVTSRTAGARSVQASPPPGAPPAAAAERIRAFVQLTKPRIIVLLLITTVPAMILAQGGMPPLWLIGATLLGGMLTAGSANAFNQYLERDIDEKMRRTRSRPLPSHAIEPRQALVFSVALGVVGSVWLALVVNLPAAALAAAAILFYVIVYTVWLKRSTPQNIVIGGAAGAAPVLVGWAAVTGTLAVEAWLLFAIIFVWTPPHFWALAMRYREDYAEAGVPMLPVLRSAADTATQILLYTIALVAVTGVLYPVARMGLVYAAAALFLGAAFLVLAVRLRWRPTPEAAVGLFRYSIIYLGVLFLAIAADGLIG